MCGIAGYITKKKYLNFSFKTTTNKLKNLMERRGPDQQGSFEHNFNDKSVNLFSSRLSIIDLDKRSNQPFKTNNTIIIFNIIQCIFCMKIICRIDNFNFRIRF